MYFEEQYIDTAKLSAEMLLTMPGVVAQQESISISENMRWSYRKRMERGELNCCKAAYGFRLIDGLLEIFEPRQKWCGGCSASRYAGSAGKALRIS